MALNSVIVSIRATNNILTNLTYNIYILTFYGPY